MSLDNKFQYSVFKNSQNLENNMVSEVRHICPKTGEYITQSEPVPYETMVVRFYKSKRPKNNTKFYNSIRKQLRYKKFSELSYKQKEAAFNYYDNYLNLTKKMTGYSK